MTINNQRRKLDIFNYLAVLAIFLFSGAGTFMNAAIQTMIDAWPNVSVSTVRMVVSIPPLVSLPVMLLIGRFVGKKISYRMCAIGGTALVAISGVAPYFMHSSWILVLVFRALLGVGVGLLAIRNPLVVLTIPKDKQAAYIGYGTVIMNLGSTIASPIVGALAQYSWKHPFLFDAIAFIPVIYMLFFLKEPVEVETVSEENITSEQKGKFTWRTYYYIVMQFITTAMLYPMLSGLSTYMADKHIGTAVLVGTILSFYNLSGMAFNMILNSVIKLLKQYTIGIMCILITVGMGLVLFVPSIPILFIGMVLAGGAFNIMVSVFQIYNGRTLPPSKVALGSTVILAMLQLGIFGSTYFVTVCHAIFNRSTDIESAFIGALIIYAVMTAMAFIMKVAPSEDYSK